MAGFAENNVLFAGSPTGFCNNSLPSSRAQLIWSCIGRCLAGCSCQGCLCLQYWTPWLGDQEANGFAGVGDLLDSGFAGLAGKEEPLARDLVEEEEGDLYR